MPRLHQKRDEKYCIIGSVFGKGFCTWQVKCEGVSFLQREGVTDGDLVSAKQLIYLHEHKWLWTGRSGIGPDAAGNRDLIPYDLVEEMAGWARQGGIKELEKVVKHGSKSYWGSCFTEAFLAWLSDIDRELPLPAFDTLSWADFDQVASPKLHQLKAPLYQAVIDHSWTLIPWRLAQVVGRIARHAEASSVCPAVWLTDYPRLERLFGDVVERIQTSNPDSRNRRHILVTPYVRWDVDDQSVRVVLPAQRLLSGQSLTWQVAGSHVSQPLVEFGSDPGATSEALSDPLGPAPVYEVALTVLPANRVERYTLSCPPRLALFALDGRLLSDADDQAHRPGNYLVLVSTSEVKGLQSTHVTDLEGVFKPDGWSGTCGYQLRAAAGAKLGSYTIAGGEATIDWKLEEPSAHSVRFLDAQPVWVEDWPRVELSSAAAFEGAILEIKQEDLHSAPGTRQILQLGQAAKVPLCHEAGKTFLDLACASPLRNLYGRLHLTCRLPNFPDLPPLTARLIRCQAVEFAYVPDPLAPDYASAVAVRGAHRIVAGADSDLVKAGEATAIRARQPLDSPSVTCLLPESHAELHIRVPVTRLRRLGPNHDGETWSRPPLPLELAGVGLEDRLRIELCQEPQLERGELLCRLVGGPPIAAGRPTRLPNTYVLPLHAWRDRLGPEASGIVQVRGQSRWLDIAYIQPSNFERLPPPPPSEGEKLVADIADAASGDQREKVMQLATECLRRSATARDGPADPEILPIAAARAFLYLGEWKRAEQCLAPLVSRLDLPEVQVYLATLELRGGQVGAGEALRARKQKTAEKLASCPQTQRLLAEYEYHFASLPGKAEAT
jgi:hypothetical protein